MKLEVGKIYENRQGDLVKITHKKREPTSLWQYVGVFYNGTSGEHITECFCEDGSWFNFKVNHRYDLIQEIECADTYETYIMMILLIL